jgi:cell wall-associated NlpC family hydrolase
MRAVVFLVLIASAASGCASSGAVPSPFPRLEPPPPPITGLERAADTSAVVGTALSLRGAPYRNGGDDPSGFDCSGFVAYVFGQQGVWVPRTVSEQYALGKPVDGASVAAGDLVFYSTTAAGASHVGIAISGGEFVHAPSSAGVVRVESLAAPYWASRFVGARRFP